MAKVLARHLFLTSILSASLVSCSASAPPSLPPEYANNPPKIQSGFYAQNTETVTIDLPRDDFLRWKSTTELSEVLTPTAGMPAVERTTLLEGDRWGKPDALRRIELSDGHYAVETILSNTPDKLSYQVWGFTSQAGKFASYATGEFTYVEQGDTTIVTWTYKFKPNSLLARIPLSLFVRNDFQPFMENGLSNMKQQSEAVELAF